MTLGRQPPQRERDLDALLRSMRPELREGEWVFVSVPAAPEGVSPLALFVEDEGVSLLLMRSEADAAGLEYSFVAAWITLRVHSALDAVGLTAAVSTKLAAAGISCNVIAAHSHDHLLVPCLKAQEALEQLEQLAASGSR
jgi:hypothetical protein